eukprot:NODE_8_length_47770_cov_0.334354.p26 type:complete len:101 gc:universal NODE_8_length_47770_cov_0.334354:26881-26579(-)
MKSHPDSCSHCTLSRLSNKAATLKVLRYQRQLFLSGHFILSKFPCLVAAMKVHLLQGHLFACSQVILSKSPCPAAAPEGLFIPMTSGPSNQSRCLIGHFN